MNLPSFPRLELPRAALLASVVAIVSVCGHAVCSQSPEVVDRSSLPAELEVLWEYKANEAIEASPHVAGQRVFVADVFGKIYAVDLATGTEIWTRDFDTGFKASPVTQDNVLAIGDVEGNFYALDATTGKTLWQTEANSEISATASFYDDGVLFTSQDGRLYCFQLASGDRKWVYETDDQIRCQPSIAADRTFLGGCDGRLHVVDLKTGTGVGEPFRLDGPTGSTPCVRADLAFVPIMDGVVYAYDWQQQKPRWQYEDDQSPQEYRSDPVANDDLVIVSSVRKNIDAISTKTGKRVWRHTLRRRADASPLIAGNDVFIAATDGRLVRLNLRDGRPRKWSYEIRGGFIAAPTVADNKLLVADDNGVLRCLVGKDTSSPNVARPAPGATHPDKD